MSTATSARGKRGKTKEKWLHANDDKPRSLTPQIHLKPKVKLPLQQLSKDSFFSCPSALPLLESFDFAYLDGVGSMAARKSAHFSLSRWKSRSRLAAKWSSWEDDNGTIYDKTKKTKRKNIHSGFFYKRHLGNRLRHPGEKWAQG